MIRFKSILLGLAIVSPAMLKAQQAPNNFTLTSDEKRIIETYRENKSDLLPSTTSTFAATVINTNFVVPIIRFNTVTKDGVDNNQKGNISFFNSIGAGVSVNFGRLELTTDKDTNIINREMNNTFGMQLGLLFASNSSSGNNTNIFAPTFSLSVLNFQLGFGYELGTVLAKEKRFFYTIAYGLPVSKLLKGGFYVLRRTPLPLNPNSGFN